MDSTTENEICFPTENEIFILSMEHWKGSDKTESALPDSTQMVCPQRWLVNSGFGNNIQRESVQTAYGGRGFGTWHCMMD